jgi:hypothetical protein
MLRHDFVYLPVFLNRRLEAERPKEIGHARMKANCADL